MKQREVKPHRTTLDRVLDFIATTRWVWVAIVAVYTILVLLGVVGLPKFSITSDVQVLLVTGVFSTLLFAIPAKKLVEYFYTPQYEFLIELNAEKDDLIKLYSVGINKMNEIEVKPSNKTMHSVRSGKSNHMKNYVREFNSEEMTAVVNWNGMQEELDMTQTQEKIKNVRINRRKVLQKGMYVWTSLETIIENIAGKFYSSESINVAELTGELEEDMEDMIERDLGLDMSDDHESDNRTAQDIIDELNEASNVMSDSDSNDGDM